MLGHHGSFVITEAVITNEEHYHDEWRWPCAKNSTDWPGLDTHNRFPDPLDWRFDALVCFGLGGVLTYRDGTPYQSMLGLNGSWLHSIPLVCILTHLNLYYIFCSTNRRHIAAVGT